MQDVEMIYDMNQPHFLHAECLVGPLEKDIHHLNILALTIPEVPSDQEH